MRIGIDFDNTVICYDAVFNRVGVEKGLIPPGLPKGKGFVRDYLREAGREDDWTRLQGEVYGTRLADASLYKGVRGFLNFCGAHQIPCVIVSHKTVYPYLGEKHNLHEAARNFIQTQQLDIESYFEQSKDEKVQRIISLACDVFIDDLPEFLELPGLPGNLRKILFDPLERYHTDPHHGVNPSLTIVNSWHEIQVWLERKYIQHEFK